MKIRNIAIIAHVDHGKTTLIDVLLRQSGTFRQNQQVAERIMDSNELERERGITILSKCTSVLHNNVRINIVDTPGHADFGGEVERILGMVDGVVVLVDAAEGPMPQTKFVVGKALKLGLRPIVVVNKVDRPDERSHEVHDEVFDLFVALEADEAQLDFPCLFASAKDGWAGTDPMQRDRGMEPLFDLIIRHVPAPHGIRRDAPFSMLVTTLEADPFLGRVLTGRIESGAVRPNMMVKALGRDGSFLESTRITKVLAFRGIQRQGIELGEAGDIVALAGLDRATVADTVCDAEVDQPLPSDPIDPPTLAMTLAVNDSPLAGTEGDKVTGRLLGERLFREAEGNVAISVNATASKDAFEVAGRGELQLAILIETMRREGFEMGVSRPRVVARVDEATGERLEPTEEVTVDVDEDFSGVVVQKLSERRGDLVEMRPSGGGKTRLVFHVPTRGLVGYLGEFLTDTSGTGVLNRIFHSYQPQKGALPGRRAGVLIAHGPGKAVAYALWSLEDRGPMFIDPGASVYQGMIVGEHNRGTDLDVNVTRSKQLTNFRAAGKDDAVRLTPPVRMTLEKALAYIEDDELVEVTPRSIRLRKRLLDPNERKRESRRERVA